MYNARSSMQGLRALMGYIYIYIGFTVCVLHDRCKAKASLGPYAWERPGIALSTARSSAPEHRGAENTSLPETVLKLLSTDVQQLARCEAAFEKLLSHEKIFLALPKPNLTAGSVLKHAFAKVESLQSRFEPMSFKIGYSHCPHFRWTNPKFGYAHCVQKYERMDVIYVAADPVGPAFVEAALIHRFKGSPACIHLPTI